MTSRPMTSRVDIPKPDITSLLPGDAEVAARRDSLVGELTADLAANPRRRRPGRGFWRSLAVFLVISMAGVGAAAAAGVFSADQMSIDGGMGCYSEASLNPEVIAILGPREDPVAVCAGMWRRGEMVRGVTEAPRLAACTGPGEPVRVMPGAGDAVCERLGLVPLPSDYADAARGWTPPPDGMPRD